MAYTVTVAESSKELTAKERIALKDTTGAVHLDKATVDAGEEGIIIKPAMYAVLDIHNYKSDDKDYKNYILADADGKTYVTGSQSFWNAFMNIYEEMEDEDEDWSIRVYRRPSKNYSGKDFITCSIL